MYSHINMTRPITKKTLAETIEARLSVLSAERLAFFIHWLENHTALGNLTDKSYRQASLTTWFNDLPPERAAHEFGLILGELMWCWGTPIP